MIKIKHTITLVFFAQLLIQMLAHFKVIGYMNTTPQYEDLVTTLLFCTMIIVYAIDEQGKSNAKTKYN